MNGDQKKDDDPEQQKGILGLPPPVPLSSTDAKRSAMSTTTTTPLGIAGLPAPVNVVTAAISDHTVTPMAYPPNALESGTAQQVGAAPSWIIPDNNVCHMLAVCWAVMHEDLFRLGEPHASLARAFVLNLKPLADALNDANIAEANRLAATLLDGCRSVEGAIVDVRAQRAKGQLPALRGDPVTNDDVKNIIFAISFQPPTNSGLGMLVRAPIPAPVVPSRPPAPWVLPDLGRYPLGISQQDVVTSPLPMPAARAQPSSPPNLSKSGSTSPVIPTTKLRVEARHLRALLPHTSQPSLFLAKRPAEDEELKASIREYGLRRPIEICGNGCASTNGTILAGHRRREAQVSLGTFQGEVLVHDNLTADGEEEILILDNLNNPQRALTHSERWELERRLRALLGRRQGRRPGSPNPRVTPPTSAPGHRGDEVGRTAAIIAARTGQSESEVRRRDRVFGSPIFSPAVRAELDAGKVSLKRVEEAVRDIEQGHDVAVAIASGTDSPINQDRLQTAREALRQRVSDPSPAQSGPQAVKQEPVTMKVKRQTGGRFEGRSSSPWGKREFLDVTVESRPPDLIVTISRQPAKRRNP